MIDTMERAGCTVDGDGNWAAGAYHLGTGSSHPAASASAPIIRPMRLADMHVPLCYRS